MDDKIQKVSIIISKGGLDGVYPGLIMANGARMEGIEANLDLDRLAATRERQEQGRDRLKELAQKARRAVRDALGGDYE